MDRPVVGDQARDAPDPIGLEEGAGAGEERDRGGGPLVVEGLGGGQEGEPVDHGMQVGAARSAPSPPGGPGRVGAPPVNAPPAPVGMRPTFLTSMCAMCPR